MSLNDDASQTEPEGNTRPTSPAPSSTVKTNATKAPVLMKVIRKLHGMEYMLEDTILPANSMTGEAFRLYLIRLYDARESWYSRSIEPIFRTLVMQERTVLLAACITTTTTIIVSISNVLLKGTLLRWLQTGDIETQESIIHVLLETAEPHGLLTSIIRGPNHDRGYSAPASVYLHEFLPNNSLESQDRSVALLIEYRHAAAFQRGWTAVANLFCFIIALVVGRLHHDMKLGLSTGADLLVFVAALRTVIKCIYK
jgi:hypothetical protein